MLKKRDFRANRDIPKVKLATSKRQRRKAVVFLFLGTILISVILSIQDKFKKYWQHFFQPATYHIIKKQDNSLEEFLGFKPNLTNLANLTKSINFLTDNLQGTYGIYFYLLNNGQEFGFNENNIFTAASVNKLPIMVSFYQQVEQGKLKEDDIYQLKKTDIQNYGSGSLRYQKLGTKYKLSQLVKLAGKQSDNTAAFVLEKLIGRKKIQDQLKDLGLKNTSMKDNTTTPKEMGKYLIWLYQGKLINDNDKEKIFQSLINTDFEDRITKGLPKDIKTAHKIGNGIQVYNDCGLILSSNPYVLCILTKKVKESEALTAIPKISRLIWEFSNQ